MNYDSIVFQKIDLSNVDEYGRLSTPNKKFNLYDGPYFKGKTMEEHWDYIENIKVKLKNKEGAVLENRRLIVCDGKILGMCSWYWKSKETNWLEIGIVIFDDENWRKGIGTKAFPMWIDYVFEIHPEITRIGLSTWSGNTAMIKLSEKIGLKLEACYKKARIVGDKYYDSISYGILREDWETRNGIIL